MYSMGQITVKIDDKLEKEFRDKIYKTKGLRKGDLAESVAEAIKLWIDEK